MKESSAGKSDRIGIFILKRCWVVILCAAIGFGLTYLLIQNRTGQDITLGYRASGTMYVYSENPNLVNYGYVSSSGLSATENLMDVCIRFIKTDKVIEEVANRLKEKYPEEFNGDINSFVADSLSATADTDVSIVHVVSTTSDPKRCRMICEAVLDVAPNKLNEIIGESSVKALDYPTGDVYPIKVKPFRVKLFQTIQLWIGVLLGTMIGVIILAILLLQRKTKTNQRQSNTWTQ